MEKTCPITEQQLLIKISNSLTEFKNCINDYDSLITNKIVNLNNYEILLKIIHISEENNRYLWNLILDKSGETLNELKKINEK